MKFTYLATLALLISGAANTFAAPVISSNSLSTIPRDFAERKLEDRAVAKPKTVKKKKTAVKKRPSAAAAKKPAAKKTTAAAKKATAAKKTTAKKPATAAKKPATAAKKPATAAKKPATAAKKPATPAKKPAASSSAKSAAPSATPSAVITTIPVVGVKQSTDSKLWPSEAQMQKSLVPGKNKAWFWSGRIGDANGQDVIAVAQDTAKKAGGATLEQTVKRVGFIMSPPGVPESIWGKASRAFADNVEGEVHVMLGESVRPQSTWNRIEFGALKANPKVTKIIAVHPLSPGKEEVLFDRAAKAARGIEEGLTARAPQKLKASIDEVDFKRLRARDNENEGLVARAPQLRASIDEVDFKRLKLGGGRRQ